MSFDGSGLPQRIGAPSDKLLRQSAAPCCPPSSPVGR